MVETQQHVGEIVASHRLARDVLILLGWSGEAMAADGMAALEGRAGEHGRFRAAAWTGDGDETRQWFVAAVRAPAVGEARPGDHLRLQAAGARTPMIACLPAAFADASSFAAELGARLGDRLPHAAQFLLETFGNRAARVLESVNALLSAVLHATAEEDGVVEIVGALDGNGLLLQGWWRQPRQGETRLLLQDESLGEHAAVCSVFTRSDLEAPAQGFVALVRPTDGQVRSNPRHVYLKSGERFRRLTVLGNAMRLAGERTVGHLRDMLPILRTEPAVERILRAATRPRYSGHDTVSTLNQPVRMGIDVAARLPGVGWYLTGWLLDPANLVTAVHLRGAGDQDLRLDRHWTRIERKDVSDGFRANPLFQGRIHHDRHGFAVFVPDATESPMAWLELDLPNDECAFMPLVPTVIGSSEDRRRLLLTVDLHKSAATEIVERQLGPLFQGLGRTRGTLPGHRTVRAGGGAASANLIVPVVDPSARTSIAVSGLARCGTADDAAITFVCSPEIGDRLDTLLRELDFYGLAADVLVADCAVDACEALAIGVHAKQGDKFLCMLPNAHPVTPDWAVRLLRALGSGASPAAVSPTLLYEDWSVRYAGVDRVSFQESAPYSDATSERAGYPLGVLAAGAPVHTLAGALECCAFTRSAFDLAKGFSPGYALPGLKGIDLFLRMRAAGVAVYWAPEVELYALDDAGGADEHIPRVGALVDGWAFRAVWCERAAELTPGNAAVIQSGSASAAEPDVSPRPSTATPDAESTAGSAATLEELEAATAPGPATEADSLPDPQSGDGPGESTEPEKAVLPLWQRLRRARAAVNQRASA